MALMSLRPSKLSGELPLCGREHAEAAHYH